MEVNNNNIYRDPNLYVGDEATQNSVSSLFEATLSGGDASSFHEINLRESPTSVFGEEIEMTWEERVDNLSVLLEHHSLVLIRGAVPMKASSLLTVRYNDDDDEINVLKEIRPTAESKKMNLSILRNMTNPELTDLKSDVTRIVERKAQEKIRKEEAYRKSYLGSLNAGASTVIGSVSWFFNGCGSSSKREKD